MLLVGHTLEAATAGAFRACRHRVAGDVGSSTEARVSAAFQIRARPDAAIDWSFVPQGLRRGPPVPIGRTVAALMSAFAATHTSAVGQPNAVNEFASPEPDAKKKKLSTSSSTDPASASTSSQIDLGAITITLRIMDETHEVRLFKVKKNTRFEKLFTTYAAKKGIAVTRLRFLIDGERINPNQTPEECDMEDQDLIECMLERVAD